MSKLKYSKTKSVISPSRAYGKPAGYDVYVPNCFKHTALCVGDSILIPLGLKISVPKGCCILFENKSGVARNMGLIVGAKVIDEDYQGEVHLHLIRACLGENGKRQEMIIAGDKIGQFVIVPIITPDLEEVEEWELFDSESERGDKGFGSSGI